MKIFNENAELIFLNISSSVSGSIQVVVIQAESIFILVKNCSFLFYVLRVSYREIICMFVK